MEKEKLIELVGVSKSYDGENVLKNLDLYIRDNEFITLLGPSGCGKLLRCALLVVLSRRTPVG